MLMKKVEVAIVGGGPAGLSAAIEAARAGASVTVFDENLSPGGQLFKQTHKFFGSQQHRAGTRGFKIGKNLLDECRRLGIEILLNTVVYGIFDSKILGIIQEDKMNFVKAEIIILATGAIENSLSFPGWTLPGVMTAGAVQTMVNIHRVLPGKRFLMIGSGNVGLIISYQLLQAGAEVVAIVEAANDIGGYSVHAAKILRAGVPIYVRHTIEKALGEDEVSGAIISKVDNNWQVKKGTERYLEVDSICLAVGLSPQIDLAQQCGCHLTNIRDLGGFLPVHNDNMETTIPGVYVAGDIAGVEEAAVAIEEGRLAGISAALVLNRLKLSEAELKKNNIYSSLQDFRSGPFGERRFEAKKELIIRYANLTKVR
jgi:thioredoxin reductase